MLDVMIIFLGVWVSTFGFQISVSVFGADVSNLWFQDSILGSGCRT